MCDVNGCCYNLVECCFLLIFECSGLLVLVGVCFDGCSVGGFFDDMFGGDGCLWVWVLDCIF